jgi:hypothetical protein
MTPDELKQKFYTLLKAGKKHKWYDRNKKNAELYSTLVSGEGLDNMMHRFKPREDAEMFKQRKELTNHIVTSVCKNVRDVEYKVPRSNSIIKSIAGAGAKELKEILDKFWGTYSFDDYMDLRWIELNDTDPNAFVVLEWKAFEATKKAQPYPFEVYSENVFWFEEVNNVLQFLIVEMGGDYTIYGDNNSIKLAKVPEEVQKKLLERARAAQPGNEFTVDNLKYVMFADIVYLVIEPLPHDLGRVPAKQVGYVRDTFTKGLTYLPPWYAAIPILKSLISCKSEMDLSMALHTFPQKVGFMPRCRAENCNKGELPDGSACQSCKGTGFQIHTSAQDAILLPLPKNKEEMPDLDNILKYFYPPVDLLKFMDEYIDKLSQRAMQFVYNSEIYSRKQVAETATGQEIDLQAVYDTLYPLVKEMAMQWTWGVEMVAKITDITGVNPSFLYSKDFKLKSLDGYYADLKTVSETSTSPFIKSQIEDDIARLIYSEDKYLYAKYLTQRKFNPFLGDTDQMVAAKTQDTNIPEYYRVLFLNFKIIFDRIELTDPEIYFWTYQKQAERVKKEVEAILTELENEKPEAIAPFGSNLPPETLPGQEGETQPGKGTPSEPNPADENPVE